MKHVLIVWELGSNLGHLGRLHLIAKMLAAKGTKVTFAVRNYHAAAPWLAARGWSCVPAPRTLSSSWGLRPPAGHADWYLCEGFDRPENVLTLVGEWSALITKLQPDGVLLDFAPAATYAIHFLQLPYLVSSVGFCAPPRFDTASCFRPWDMRARTAADRAHAQLLEVFLVNRKALGNAAASSLGELFSADRVSLCTFAEMDHFPDRLPSTNYFGVLWDDASVSSVVRGVSTAGVHVHWNEGNSKKVFCYLNGEVEHITPLLEVLKSSGHDVIAVVPRLSQAWVARHVNPKLQVFLEPIAISALLGQSDAVVCHGGVGLVGRSLCAGAPVFLLPQYAEQAILGRRISQQKLGVATSQTAVPEVLLNKLEVALESKLIRDSVRLFAEKYKNFSSHEAVAPSLSAWF